MPAGVLVDTSFLITLANSTRRNHEDAHKYWRHFLEQEIPIYLSVIVAAEYSLHTPLAPEILRNCLTLTFAWDDAMKAAELGWMQQRPEGVVRDALKDDVKIIAQAVVSDVEYVITADAQSFYRYCKAFQEAGKVSFKAISLADGFDRSFFTPNGQRDFVDDLDSNQT